jgi:hypothetical protein
MNLLDNVAGVIMDSDVSIKFNEHEFHKNKKNDLCYSTTKDGIKTSIRRTDNHIGFERVSVKDNDTKTETL